MCSRDELSGEGRQEEGVGGEEVSEIMNSPYPNVAIPRSASPPEEKSAAALVCRLLLLLQMVLRF
jgi:hypothetical protein